MQKKRVLSLILALSCTAALLGGCAGNNTSDDNTASGEHEVITMNAPYRNMSQFYDLVHEKYPEINLEIIPYNGENTSSYMKDMRLSGELPDIYSTTYYTPGRMDDEGDFLDLSGYDFMDNYTPSRLRDVSYNGGIYMLPWATAPSASPTTKRFWTPTAGRCRRTLMSLQRSRTRLRRRAMFLAAASWNIRASASSSCAPLPASPSSRISRSPSAACARTPHLRQTAPRCSAGCASSARRTTRSTTKFSRPSLRCTARAARPAPTARSLSRPSRWSIPANTTPS